MLRRRVAPAAVPAVALGLAVVLAGCGGLEPAAGGPAPSGPATASAALPVPAGAQEATVVRGVDGDTVVLRGRGAGPLPTEPTKVRVLLVDTPEVFGEQECFGREAADRAAALLPDGAQVRVEADRDERDRYDRVLLHVWTAAGVHVGADLLRGGYATVLYVAPNVRYRAELEAVQRDAHAAERGLWSACR